VTVIGDGDGDGSSASSPSSSSPERSTARKVCSAVYLAVTALLPAAVVINLVNHHWFYLFVAVVATVFLVPVAIALSRQSGPAAKLTFPIALTVVLGALLVGAGLG
jgi:heme O synthase-like polyprenyltransferase